MPAIACRQVGYDGADMRRGHQGERDCFAFMCDPVGCDHCTTRIRVHWLAQVVHGTGPNSGPIGPVFGPMHRRSTSLAESVDLEPTRIRVLVAKGAQNGESMILMSLNHPPENPPISSGRTQPLLTALMSSAWRLRLNAQSSCAGRRSNGRCAMYRRRPRMLLFLTLFTRIARSREVCRRAVEVRS